MRQELDRIFDGFPSIHTVDIPGIDLYMDQVTTFLQENLRGMIFMIIPLSSVPEFLRLEVV